MLSFDNMEFVGGVLIAAIFFVSLLVFAAKFFLGVMRKSKGSIETTVEDASALAQAEAKLAENDDSKWVTIASASTHQGYREADLHGAVAFLGSKGIEATFRTSTAAEGIQDFSLLVKVDDVEKAKTFLTEFLSK